MSELKKVKVVNSGYIKHFSESYEKFVHLEDYQRLRDQKPELPEGYRVEGNALFGKVGDKIAFWHEDEGTSGFHICYSFVWGDDALAIAAFLQGAR